MTTISSGATVDDAAADNSDEVDSEADDEDFPVAVDGAGVWWHKFEPLISTFREACRSGWTPSSNVSIDEKMIKFQGRSQPTVKMLKKPIKQGYKMWASCERGYLLNSCTPLECMERVSSRLMRTCRQSAPCRVS